MPSAPSFIRYFAHTDNSELGKIALEYLRSMVRIAPVRVVSMSGGLVGAWDRLESMLLTPMTGSYVNAVCCHPSRWIWEAVVPMTDAAADICDPDLPAAPHVVVDGSPNDRHVEVEMPAMQPTTEYARGVEELYTPKVRNVLFIGTVQTTDQQHATARKYEAVILPDLARCQTISARWPDLRFDGAVVPVPVLNHARIREAIVGAS